MTGVNEEINDTTNIHDFVLDDEDSIENDIIMGKDEQVISAKWDISVGYVRNVSSKLRKKGVPIPKRNSKGWRVISIMRKQDI